VSEADEHFLERLRQEIEPLLTTWAQVIDLRLERLATGVRIVLALETRTGPAEVVGVGENVVEAAGALPACIGETRLGLALRELVGAHGR
jgi:hypothetical protein